MAKNNQDHSFRNRVSPLGLALLGAALDAALATSAAAEKQPDDPAAQAENTHAWRRVRFVEERLAAIRELR